MLVSYSEVRHVIGEGPLSCSYLSSLSLFAAHISQTLDLGLQLLRLTGDLLDFLGHFLTLLMDLVTLPGEQFKCVWFVFFRLLVCRTDCEIIPMNQIFYYSVNPMIL